MSVECFEFKRITFPMDIEGEDVILYEALAKGMTVHLDDDGNELPNNVRFFGGFKVVQIRLENDDEGAEVLLKRRATKDKSWIESLRDLFNELKDIEDGK